MSDVNWGKIGLTLAGYVVGYLIGGGIGAVLGGVIGGVVGSLVFPDDPTRIQGTRLQNFVQTSEYGYPISILFGHDRMGGCVIWNGPRSEHIEETEEGGKGGGGGVVYETYYYTQSFAVLIGRGGGGPINKLFRIWADNKLVYDCKPENDGPMIGQSLRFTFYPGTEDQMPDPVIESYKGVGNTPAYRGSCYIVFEDLNITEYGGRIPNLNFEVATESEDAYPEVEVDIGGLMGAQSSSVGQMMKFSNGEYSALRYGDYWAIIDTVSNRVLAAKEVTETAPITLSMPWAAASDGYIYAIGSVGGGYAPFSMDRFLNIAMSPNEDEPVSGVGYVAVPKSAASPLLWVGCSPSARGGYIILYNRFSLMELARWDVAELWGSNALASHMAVDGDGYVWVIIQITTGAGYPTGLSYLVKLVPLTGGAIQYTLTTAGASYVPNILGYCRQSNRLFLSGSHAIGTQTSQEVIWVWDIDEEGVVAQFGPAEADGHDYEAGLPNLASIDTGELFAERDDTHYIAINTSTLEVVREYEIANWPTPPNFHRSYVIYDHICNALWPMFTRGEDGVFHKLLLDRGSRETVLLGPDVAQPICEEVGLSASDLDLTEIATDEVRGYCIGQQMTARQALEPLQQAFFFDWVEVGGKITAVKRGGASVVTIPEEDLAVYEEGQECPDELPIAHAQPVALPRVLNIKYVDVDQSYQPGTQRSIRQTVGGKGETTITLPLVLTATEAKRIAEILHYIAYLEANHYAPVYLPPKYLNRTVTDVVTVERGGNTYLLHLQKIDLGANYLMRCEAIPEDAALYNSSAIGDGGTPPDENINYPGITEFWPLDTPYARDNEYYATPSGFYMAACGRRDAWRGAQLFRSLDEGVSYQVIQAMLKGAVIGLASDALGAPGDPWTWDYHNVTIRLLNKEDELASCSKLNALNGTNVFLLGRPETGWELCAFCDVTLNEDETYTLGTLIRGMRGTEWMCGEHSAGDIFIMLSSTTIYRIADQASDLDKERLYAAVSLGMPFSSATLRTFTNTGRGLMPYAPQHIKGSRDGSNNLTMTWMRRARVDGEWRDGVETPLDEASEGYEVDIINGGSVVRTFESLTSPECTYTAAQQTEDGFTPGDPIPVEVFQMSASIGRGFAGERTI